MSLLSEETVADIEKIAQKSTAQKAPTRNASAKNKSLLSNISNISKEVQEIFKDSPAKCIHSPEELHKYIDLCIENKIAAIDTETTGLDRYQDKIVGVSLFTPNYYPIYIPIKHIHVLSEELYEGQLTYEEVKEELQRFVDNKVKLVFANAAFDLAMIENSIGVNLEDVFYFDVLIAWRCIKENEQRGDTNLKDLYHKYVAKDGLENSKRFSDLFSPYEFPRCKPEVGALYAANDAQITYELYEYQLQYIDKDNEVCKKYHLEQISDLIWNIEMPMVKVCHYMSRTGIYLDDNMINILKTKYHRLYHEEEQKLRNLVQDVLDTKGIPSKCPFRSGAEFNPESTPQTKFLFYDILGFEIAKKGTGKDIMAKIDHPIAKEITYMRSLGVLVNTFVDKLPDTRWYGDNRVHAEFKQIGADTGRMSCKNPNLQNIPSKITDIRRMFRATPGYVIMSSDYSSQEPRITAFVSGDKKMIQAFKDNKDIYASIASLAFNKPYEQCLEFNPQSGEYQAEGKHRRSAAKQIVLGICYGREVPSIADQLYGDKGTKEQRIKDAQDIYDAVMRAFPGLQHLMDYQQAKARKLGYVETVKGRRRHLPDMQLEPFTLKATEKYVSGDLDPLDLEHLENNLDEETKEHYQEELSKIWGRQNLQKAITKLNEIGISVRDNRAFIQRATRQTVNAVIQGSAADQTKLAMIELYNNEEWHKIGGRILIPVHDEILAEVPIENCKRGAEILSSCMLKAADYLPFPSKCDVTTTIRWYGLEYPCPYEKPTSLNLSEDNIRWIQYHLFEAGYVLPIIPDPSGKELEGNAVYGINGIMTKEVNDFIQAFKTAHKVQNDLEFFDAIEKFVIFER